MFFLTCSCCTSVLRSVIFLYFIPCSLLLFCHSDALAQSDARLQQNMQLSCYDVQHISASGDELSYRDYWDRFSFDGKGTYNFGVLGKYGNQEGLYNIDPGGKVKFEGPLGAMTFTYKYNSKEENAYGKLENKYTLTFTESNGTRHICDCIVLGREKNTASLPAPKPGGEKLSGLYFYYTPDMYDPVTGIKQTYSKYYYFMSNGYVHMGLPSGGLEKCNCADNRYKKNCKTYTIAGTMITFSGENPKPFSRKGKNLVIDEEALWPVTPVSESSLPGNYKLMWSVSGGVHQTFWNFKSDHSFTQTAVGAANPAAVFGIPANSKDKELKGTWKIKGSMLELRYSHGEAKTHTLVHTYGEKDEITIDGASCYRM